MNFRKRLYFVLLGYLAYVLVARLFTGESTAAGIFQSSTVLIPVVFLAEIFWLGLARRPLRDSSLFRLLRFKETREMDYAFWAFSSGGLFPPGVDYISGKIDVWLRAMDPVWDQARPWSLASLPWPLVFLAAYLTNSLISYIYHRAAHKIPALWELHKVHHSAEELTVLTVYREHPFEGAAYYFLRGTALSLLGFDPTTIAAVFLAYALQAHLAHSGIEASWGWLDHFIVSPAAHRLHHSADARHHDCNFSTDLPLWDMLCGTRMRPGETPSRLGLSDDFVLGKEFFPMAIAKSALAFLQRLGGRKVPEKALENFRHADGRVGN